MLIKRSRIGDLVFGTLVLSSCFIAACAVGIDNAVELSADEGGQSSAGASDMSVGGSVGSPAGAGGRTGAGGTGAAGRGGGSAIGGGGRGNGGATGGGGRGGVGRGGATAGGGRGGAGPTGGAGRGGAGRGGAGPTGGAGRGGASATGGAATGTGTTVKIDLSTFQPVAAGSYNGIAQTLAVVAEPFIQFPLPRTFNAGQRVAVHVAGTNNGTAGLRSWLVDSAQTTLSNVVTTYVGVGLPAGSFMLDYTLTATSPAGFLFFKGSSVGTNIDNVTLSSITITY
jgi:hypothetical protein